MKPTVDALSSLTRTCGAALAFTMLFAACGRSYLWPGFDTTLSGGDGGSAGNGNGGDEGGNGGADAGGSANGGSANGGSANGGSANGGSANGGSGGTGGAVPCVLDADCDDGDFCTTNTCDGASCSVAFKDADADGVVDLACGGGDCNDLNPNVHPGLAENCTDAADNDCNGVADCFDPACALAPKCGCVPLPSGENCTNGKDEDCDTTVDCNDADCIGTPACGCAANELGNCADGIDDDCDGPTDCADSDCFGEAICQCQSQPEICGNSADEDCDLLIDCADKDCQGTSSCLCFPPGVPETCANATDDDCDKKVDCGDPDCAASVSCKSCMQEICDNGKDDDCDNAIDCADDACAFAAVCQPTQEKCNNSLDDDNDGLVDCADPECAANPTCAALQEYCNTAKLISATGKFTGDTTGYDGENMGACGGGAGEAVFYFVLSQPARVHLDSKGTSFDSVLYVRHGACKAGPELVCDDDSGGQQWAASIDFTILYPGTYFVFLDGFTIDPNFGPNEGPFVLNVEIEPNPQETSVARCSDKIDNDGDVYVDCADPGCKTVGSCLLCDKGQAPAAEFGVAKCTDLRDNDCDGLTDGADSDCDASPFASALEDCDGTDDNDNGVIDDFSCRCASDGDCLPGELCYTHTIHSCGVPCSQFFGNICPAIEVGTGCSMATNQCEF
ncbi:MAG: hypothetical protein EXR75_02475 [Myxococcales bacterium]|nr:hypothetical protein [Myxococcales bacterium]